MVLSSNFGNVFSILAASAWLPYTPVSLLESFFIKAAFNIRFKMSNLQILAQNLLYDVSQIAIPWDNVDDEYLQNPKAWKPWGE